MADAVAPAPARAGSGRLRMIALLVVVAVLAAAGAFTAMRLLAGPSVAAAAEPAEPVEGAVVDVAEMTATLAGDPPHLARVGIAVVLEESADEAAVSPRFALLRDATVSELTRSPAPELMTSDGVDSLRDRLTARAQDIYPDGEVLRVVLTELVIQ